MGAENIHCPVGLYPNFRRYSRRLLKFMMVRSQDFVIRNREITSVGQHLIERPIDRHKEKSLPTFNHSTSYRKQGTQKQIIIYVKNGFRNLIRYKGVR